MTVPTPPEVALAFEKRAETVVTLRFSAELQRVALAILRASATLEARAGGQPSISAITELRRAVVRRLEKVAPGMGAALEEVIEGGIALGVRQSGGRESELPTRAPGDSILLREPEAIDRRAEDAIRRAMARVATMPLASASDAVAMAATVQLPARQAESAARWAANRAINAGIAEVARDFGELLVWVPERNACLHCLAYAGQVVTPGQSFPSNLTFAGKPLRRNGSLPYPPLHPNCRCAVRRYNGPPPSADPSSNDLASALAREARRSVARGWSDFASLSERQRAAGRLLQRGAGLAPTVVARAERDVARGKFSTRHIPRGIGARR